ncbi:MAG: 5'/3'-nucleotidase SurE [Chlorobi bacterium]|nr:5'/3'-nucleotidase SurE [Chlorobiota bacterium]
MGKAPLIVVVNDDGYAAKGLNELVLIMRKLGEVIVVSTDQPMSGMSHAVTIQTPLRINLIRQEEGFKEYRTNGTPVDAVKLAKHSVLDKKPDLVVSGINHGSNASINIIYSGTMAAVLEACIDGIPAIGFSLCDYYPDADFSHVYAFLERITAKVIKQGLPKGVALNVNFPKKSEEAVKGIKVVRQAEARWVEDFEERTDPYRRKYYWMGGHFVNGDEREDTDEKALHDNYVSVVPVNVDFTAHEHVNKLKF